MKTTEDLLKRIEELEQRIRSLEARPVYLPMPYPVAVPLQGPVIPRPPLWNPPPGPLDPYRITC